VDLNGDKRPDLIFVDVDQEGVVSLVNQLTAGTATLAATTTTLQSSAASIAAGQPLTLTSTTAAASGSVVPAGTTTFSDGSTILGSSSLDAGGKATFTTSSLAPGSHSLTAAYGGSTTFSTSVSSSTTVQVTGSAADFSASADPTSLTVTAGQSATVALTVTPLNGSTQQVSISCSGLPAYATCGFSPAPTVTLDGTQPSTVTMTVRTNVAAMLHRALTTPALASFGGGIGGGLLMMALCGAVIRRRWGYTVTAATVLLGIVSCGGGHGGHGGAPSSVTPSGTYPVTISLVSGATTHTVALTLVVN
jgi:VCBS repeat-containing protein